MTADRRGPAAPERTAAPQHTAAPERKAASRVIVLDGLRFAAATMVVLYHYVGVPRSKIGKQGTAEVMAWGTSASRVFPHALNLLAGFGWTGVELFFQGAYGVPNLNPAFWTLFIELKFYLLFGLAAIGGVTYRRMVTFCVLWSVGSIAAVGSHNPVLALLMSPRYSPYFIAGIAFYLIHRFGSNLLLWAIVTYSWLLTLDNPRANPRWEVTVLLTSFFVIMALVATHRLDWVRWRWLTLAGALTYPLYLIHQDVGFTVISYLHGRVPAPLLAAATFAAMLALAWLIHRVVERPIAPLLRARLTSAVDGVRRSGLAAQPALRSVIGTGTARHFSAAARSRKPPDHQPAPEKSSAAPTMDPAPHSRPARPGQRADHLNGLQMAVPGHRAQPSDPADR